MQHLISAKKMKATVVQGVSSSVSTLGSYVYERSLASSPVIRGLNRSFSRQQPRLKRTLHLHWGLGDLWRYIRTLPPLQQRPWSKLVGLTICLARGLTGKRLTEIEQFGRRETRPNADCSAWPFHVLCKGKRYRETVVLRRGDDPAVDPVAHAFELDRRISLLQPPNEPESDSLWIREDGRAYSYEAISALVVETMHSAGISDSHGYHIKHAATTALVRASVPSEQITAFLNHKHGSTVYLNHYADLSSDNSCAAILAKL